MTEPFERLSKETLAEELAVLEERLVENRDQDELRNLLQNLRVHQIELEMQNRELREAHQALEEARDRYADLYDFAPIGYMTLDAQGVIREINLTGARMLGEPRADLIGRPLATRLEAGQSKAFFRHLRHVFDDETKATVELTLQSGHGGVCWASLESVRARENGDAVCRTALLDITERRRMEDDLRHREHQLRLVTDAAPMLIAYVDSDMRYRFANAAYREWFDLEPEQMIGRRVVDLMKPDAFAVLLPFAERALRGEKMYYENVVNHKRLGKRETRASLVPDRNPDGGIDGYFSVAMDTTEQKRSVEQEKRRLLKAAHADRLSTIGQISTEIAHELNQPLTAIATTADVCVGRARQLEGRQGEVLAEALQEISNQAHRAAAVVKNVRIFARRRDPEIVPLRLEPVIDNALSLVEVEARACNVTIDKRLKGQLTVEGDAVLLEQLLVNLARNAVEAMTNADVAAPRLTLTVAPVDGKVEIRIADNGPGLSVSAREHLFEPFYTTKSEGTGLGLSICRSIAEAHDGRLRMDSSPEGGAEFIVTLNPTTDDARQERHND